METAFKRQAQHSAQERFVLVTGASSGIGRACALMLERRGFTVFAGVRAGRDADALKAESAGTLIPVLLDVTEESAIQRAFAEIRQHTAVLNGVVNNAGIAVACPLEFLPLEDLRRQLEVNVTGLLAVTQAALPLLREARAQGQPARIVNISSIAGRLAFPLLGPYCASKFAVEALSDSLRLELSSWKIDVSIIEPGKIDTPIWNKSVEDAEARKCNLSSEAFELYGDPMNIAQQRALDSNQTGIEPIRVARAVHHALTARRPKTRYVIGNDCRLGLFLSRLPDGLRDRLIRHKYGE